MYNVKYVFAQLVAFLNRSKFNRIVAIDILAARYF